MVLLPFLLLASIPQATDHDVQNLRAMEVGYRANRERLRPGSCRYVSVQGEADNLADARRGALKAPKRAECFFAHSEAAARIDRDYPLEFVASRTQVIGGKRIVSPALSAHCLTDYKSTFSDSVGVRIDAVARKVVQPPEAQHYVEIRAGMEAFSRELDSPLRLGHPEGDHHDFGNMVESLRNGKDGVTLVSLKLDSTYEDVEVAEVAIKRSNSEVRYFVDMNRGCIPRRVHAVNRKNGRELTICYDEIRDVGDRVYYPFKKSLYHEDGLAIHVAVSEFRPGPPLSSAFELSFDKPVKAVDTIHHASLGPRKSFGLEVLRGPTTPRARAPRPDTQVAGSRAPEMPGEIEPGYSATGIGTVGALVLGALAAIGVAVFRIRGTP